MAPGKAQAFVTDDGIARWLLCVGRRIDCAKLRPCFRVLASIQILCNRSRMCIFSSRIFRLSSIPSLILQMIHCQLHFSIYISRSDIKSQFYDNSRDHRYCLCRCCHQLTNQIVRTYTFRHNYPLAVPL